jgi:probable F420-dependent oxidoreductase
MSGFRVDVVLPPGIEAARQAAKTFEATGYDGLYTVETTNDPFLDLAFPAIETTRPMLGNNLAIAFARSPYVTAVLAWNLQQASKGRFCLGLGTQVKGHIERRFGMPWESPGPKFREYVAMLKELWSAWQERRPAQHRGRFYNSTVNNPFFTPGPIDYPAPKVFIAAINEYNAETVGFNADGILIHPLHSPKYIDDVLMPAINKGLARSGRKREDITIVCPIFLAVGDTDEQAASAASFVKQQAAFYGSTRSYRRIFETHGWDETPTKLHERMSKGDMAGMASEITDEMVEVFAITGRTDGAVDEIKRRYETRVDRIYFYNAFATPFADEGRQRELIAALSAS